jgi:hypothetical protein
MWRRNQVFLGKLQTGTDLRGRSSSGCCSWKRRRRKRAGCCYNVCPRKFVTFCFPPRSSMLLICRNCWRTWREDSNHLRWMVCERDGQLYTLNTPCIWTLSRLGTTTGLWLLNELEWAQTRGGL